MHEKKLNVAVVMPHEPGVPLFEAQLEIMQNHLDRGDAVTFLRCDADLLSCNTNYGHDLERCLKCMAIRQDGLALLSPPVVSRPFRKLTDRDRQELATLQTEFRSAEEMRQYRVDEFDIGMSVLSTILTMTRDPEPDLRACAPVIRGLILSSYVVFRSLQHYLDEHPTDRVYLFNGRFANERAIVRACQSRKVDYFVHEVGQNMHHYGLWKNASPHALDYTEKEMRRRWQEAEGDPQREAIATEFFVARVKGIPQSCESFVARQAAGLLPANWDPRKKNLVIYNTSEDEFAAISDEWTNTIYHSQIDGTRRIVASLADCGSWLHIYIRMHPNNEGMPAYYLEMFRALRSPMVTVLDPLDKASTYAMLQAADKVLTFGSTVGIEATFWGKPSILASEAFYANLGGTYNPKTHEELIELVKTDPLPPKDKTAALMYGYYYNTYGIPWKYYRPISFDEGEFKGKNLLRTHKWLWRLTRRTRGWKAKEVLVTRPFRAYTERKMRGGG